MRPVLITVACSALALVACKSEKKRASSDEERSALASAAISASALPPRGEPPAGWSLLRPTGAGYSVFVPGVAEKLDGGLSDIHAVKRPSGYAYMAMCMTTDQPDETFKGMRRGKIGDRKLRSEEPVDDGRGKGERLAIEMETDKGLVIVNELLLIGRKRVCSFTAMVAASADEKGDIDRFFDSARLDD